MLSLYIEAGRANFGFSEELRLQMESLGEKFKNLTTEEITTILEDHYIYIYPIYNFKFDQKLNDLN